MDKKVTKKDFIAQIKGYLKGMGIPKGEAFLLNKIVSRQKVICNGEHNIETKVTTVKYNSIGLEWYDNGKLKDWSGEYPYSHANINYGVVMNVAALLRECCCKLKTNN